jgi:hypothetical protein
VSLSTLSTVAVQRDAGPPRRTKPKPKTAAEAQATEQQGYLNVLVSAIPTEPLALYTFLIGGIVATIDAGESQRLKLRWGIYAVMVIFIVAWLGASYLRGRAAKDRKRKFPVAETAAAVVAFASWGLVMPQSPLNAELSGDDRVVWTLIITVAGTALLSLLGLPLKEQAKK